jgi:hypothetical protein
MTSDNRTAANRRNAKKSTGPRTRDGKATVSRNALRHGLDAVSSGDFGLSEKTERLAEAICRQDADPVSYRQALIVAESFLDIARVRAVRVRILEASPEPPSLHLALPRILRLERYERRALSRRRRALRTLDEFAANASQNRPGSE